MTKGLLSGIPGVPTIAHVFGIARRAGGTGGGRGCTINLESKTLSPQP